MENLSASSVLDVPNSHRTICGPRDQGIAVILECPNTTFMALEGGLQSSSLGIVHIDVRVITSRENFVCIELQARNNVPIVGTEGNVLRFDSRLHPTSADGMMPAVEGFVEIQASERGKANFGVRDGSRGRVCCSIRSLGGSNLSLPVRLGMIRSTGRNLSL
jgi:hypothetical protein